MEPRNVWLQRTVEMTVQAACQLHNATRSSQKNKELNLMKPSASTLPSAHLPIAASMSEEAVQCAKKREPSEDFPWVASLPAVCDIIGCCVRATLSHLE
jgi:hypothetical protein